MLLLTHNNIEYRIDRMRRSKNPAVDGLLPGGRGRGMKGVELYGQVLTSGG
jgi:hypothetical protein